MRFSAKLGKNVRFSAILFKVILRISAKVVLLYDFLLSRGAKLWPMEVKSSGYKTHASLDAFCEKFSDRVGERFLVFTKDLRKDGPTTLLPVVMAGLL